MKSENTIIAVINHRTHFKNLISVETSDIDLINRSVERAKQSWEEHEWNLEFTMEYENSFPLYLIDYLRLNVGINCKKIDSEIEEYFY